MIKKVFSLNMIKVSITSLSLQINVIERELRWLKNNLSGLFALIKTKNSFDFCLPNVFKSTTKLEGLSKKTSNERVVIIKK